MPHYAVLLAALYLLYGSASYAARLPLRVHLAISVSTHTANHHLLETGRLTWRKGVPTVVVTNGTTERKIDSAHAHEVWWEGVDYPAIGWNNAAESRCASPWSERRAT